ncbi:hypothetical protein HS125_16175, partial [bacterium]|nr:hypothetical protein [bacterium]
MGAAGALTMLDGGSLAAPAPRRAGDARRQLTRKVFSTPLVDTHEHLLEEAGRMPGSGHPRVSADDWTFVLSHYLNSDLVSAGMPRQDIGRFFSSQLDPLEKWPLLAPYWPAVKHTGYGQAVRITLYELYGVPDLSDKTIEKVAEGYGRARRPGFYRDILSDRAQLASCQVNSLEGPPFMRSRQPTLLMQDIAIAGMIGASNIERYRRPTGIELSELSDWHRVIDWWFETFGRYAVAAKSTNAYARDINYARVPAETAAPIFRRRLAGEATTREDKKALEDHLFWYAVDRATRAGLPVKLHTGYYAGNNGMPLARVRDNPASACELCRAAPDTRFVFMHIG